jgi:NMT1/THI5 like
MEQFVARTGFAAATLKDLKGARIMSAPGPANLVAAKAVLAKAGLNEGDYTIDQLDMSQHVNVMTSGTFDAGYTLEPQASTMRKLGVARTLEAGVIAKYILGDEDGNAFAAGCAVTRDFIKSRPDVARRFAAVWKRGIDFSQPKSAGGAQISRQEHAHPRRRRRYRPDGALLHGGRAHRQAQGGVPEIHRLLDRRRHPAGESRHHQISAGILESSRRELRSSSLPGLTPQVGFTRLAAHNTGAARVSPSCGAIHLLRKKIFGQGNGCAGHKRVHARP